MYGVDVEELCYWCQDGGQYDDGGVGFDEYVDDEQCGIYVQQEDGGILQYVFQLQVDGFGYVGVGDQVGEEVGVGDDEYDY